MARDFLDRSPDSDREKSNNCKFLLRVGSDRGIIARVSLIVRNLVNQGFWQDASLANTLLGVIWGKVLAIAPKWGDIRKVDLYCYFQECYTETFRIICSYAAELLVK
jgi:hypothetical protein